MHLSTAFQTVTVDRGKRFSCYQQVEKDLKIAAFSADPYFTRPTKSSTASYYSKTKKYLGWKTAHKAFQYELSRLD